MEEPRRDKEFAKGGLDQIETLRKIPILCQDLSKALDKVIKKSSTGGEVSDALQPKKFLGVLAIFIFPTIRRS